MPHLQVLPECYADTALVRLFIPSFELVVHISGIPNVAKEMQESFRRADGQITVGFVDNDKRVPPYLHQFETILQENRVILKQKPDSHQHLIVIDKAIESFLIWNAQQIELDIANYGFVAEIKAFGKALKTVAVGSAPHYLQLLTDLRTQQAPGFITLQRILHELTP